MSRKCNRFIVIVAFMLTIFCAKVDQIISIIFGLFWKCYFWGKNYFSYFLSNCWNNFRYVLFWYLVTLLITPTRYLIYRQDQRHQRKMFLPSCRPGFESHLRFFIYSICAIFVMWKERKLTNRGQVWPIYKTKINVDVHSTNQSAKNHSR